MGRLISEKYAAWQAECEERFQQLKKNEEELNRIFIDIYGLQDELTPDVADKDVTVHRVFDSKDDVPESMKGSNYVRTMRDEIDLDDGVKHNYELFADVLAKIK